MTLRAPDGTGIKGGKIEYHVERMLRALAFVPYSYVEFLGDKAAAFAADIAVYHARLAARAALNKAYNGRRPQ